MQLDKEPIYQRIAVLVACLSCVLHTFDAQGATPYDTCQSTIKRHIQAQPIWKQWLRIPTQMRTKLIPNITGSGRQADLLDWLIRHAPSTTTCKQPHVRSHSFRLAYKHAKTCRQETLYVRVYVYIGQTTRIMVRTRCHDDLAYHTKFVTYTNKKWTLTCRWNVSCKPPVPHSTPLQRQWLQSINDRQFAKRCAYQLTDVYQPEKKSFLLRVHSHCQKARYHGRILGRFQWNGRTFLTTSSTSGKALLASLPLRRDTRYFQQLVSTWRTRWEELSDNLNSNDKAFAAMYHPNFRHAVKQMTKQQYIKRLTTNAKKVGPWRILIGDVHIIKRNKQTMVTRFQQFYQRRGYFDIGYKTLHWKAKGNRWLISREQWTKQTNFHSCKRYKRGQTVYVRGRTLPAESVFVSNAHALPLPPLKGTINKLTKTKAYITTIHIVGDMNRTKIHKAWYTCQQPKHTKDGTSSILIHAPEPQRHTPKGCNTFRKNDRVRVAIPPQYGTGYAETVGLILKKKKEKVLVRVRQQREKGDRYTYYHNVWVECAQRKGTSGLFNGSGFVFHHWRQW